MDASRVTFRSCYHLIIKAGEDIFGAYRFDFGQIIAADGNLINLSFAGHLIGDTDTVVLVVELLTILLLRMPKKGCCRCHPRNRKQTKVPRYYYYQYAWLCFYYELFRNGGFFGQAGGQCDRRCFPIFCTFRWLAGSISNGLGNDIKCSLCKNARGCRDIFTYRTIDDNIHKQLRRCFWQDDFPSDRTSRRRSRYFSLHLEALNHSQHNRRTNHSIAGLLLGMKFCG